ncbi:MAG: DUF3316 domain-containing protein [Duncaniella sp.]|nr:DUF3316 domain-containing protein [Duncaniella sp.]
MRRVLLLMMAALAVLTAAADDDADVTALRPVHSAYLLEAGGSRLADTYLSPIPYEGIHFGFTYQRYQAMKFSPDRWTMSLTLRLGLDKTDNRARNSSMWDLSLTADWGMMRRYSINRWLTLAPGASTTLTGGAIYAAANSNNPVSAKASWTVNFTGLATARFHIKRLPVTVTYRPTLPVVGAFFSPDYGELYYEIYLGNSSGLAHAAWWDNYFLLDNLVTAQLEFGSTYLSVGYHGSIFSTRVNHLTTNIFTHSFVIGIAGEWLSLNPRKGITERARVIHALY